MYLPPFACFVCNGQLPLLRHRFRASSRPEGTRPPTICHIWSISRQRQMPRTSLPFPYFSPQKSISRTRCLSNFFYFSEEFIRVSGDLLIRGRLRNFERNTHLSLMTFHILSYFLISCNLSLVHLIYYLSDLISHFSFLASQFSLPDSDLRILNLQFLIFNFHFPIFPFQILILNFHLSLLIYSHFSALTS